MMKFTDIRQALETAFAMQCRFTLVWSAGHWHITPRAALVG